MAACWHHVGQRHRGGVREWVVSSFLRAGGVAVVSGITPVAGIKDVGGFMAAGGIRVLDAHDRVMVYEGERGCTRVSDGGRGWARVVDGGPG